MLDLGRGSMVPIVVRGGRTDDPRALFASPVRPLMPLVALKTTTLDKEASTSPTTDMLFDVSYNVLGNNICFGRIGLPRIFLAQIVEHGVDPQPHIRVALCWSVPIPARVRLVRRVREEHKSAQLGSSGRCEPCARVFPWARAKPSVTLAQSYPASLHFRRSTSNASEASCATPIGIARPRRWCHRLRCAMHTQRMGGAVRGRARARAQSPHTVSRSTASCPRRRAAHHKKLVYGGRHQDRRELHRSVDHASAPTCQGFE